MRVRHPAYLIAASIALVLLLEPRLFDPSPLVGRLDGDDRTELYKQVTTVTASLLGFLITAVAILVSLDVRRRIVQELNRGQSFSLLVINLLACILMLFVTTSLGVAAAVADTSARGSAVFERIYEIALVSSALQLGFGLGLFGIVTYKVASYD
jgi:hypothetical protein